MTWCQEHEITIKDLETICQDKNLDYTKFKDKNILITGGTGQIGSALAKTLLYLSDQKNLNLKLFINCRDEKKFQKVFAKHLTSHKNLYSLPCDLTSAINKTEHFDFIIHTASVTSSVFFVQKPIRTITTTILGTQHILELAVQNKAEVLYVSSMEVYGQTTAQKISEDGQGTLNFQSLRSSYPESKRCAELLCLAYAAECDLKVKIVRPTLTFGSALSPSDNRVYAQFLRSVLEHKDIVLHTKGETERDYLYLYDAVHAMLSVILKGQSGEAYNLSNPETYCSILELAKLTQSFASDTAIIFDLDVGKKGIYAPIVKLGLDTSKLDALNPFPKKSLREMLATTLALTKAAQNS